MSAYRLSSDEVTVDAGEFTRYLLENNDFADKDGIPVTEVTNPAGISSQPYQGRQLTDGSCH